MGRGCSVYGCLSSAVHDKNVRFHRFPLDERLHNWIDACGRPELKDKSNEQLYNLYVCSIHFETWMYINKKKNMRILRLKDSAIPIRNLPRDSLETIFTTNEKQSQASPSRSPKFPCMKISDVDAFNTALQDSLVSGRTEAEQCRICGEFCKTCVPVYPAPYLFKNKITLAVNESIVQLDFEDDSLPKTACRECDAKLREIYDFTIVVKSAQINLIKVRALDMKEVNIENEHTEDSETVKTEHDDDTVENRDEENENKNKDGIFDSETIVKTVPQKRKVNTGNVSAKKPKKAEVTTTKRENKYSDLYIEIKEELIRENKYSDLYIEIKQEEDVIKTGCSISDTGTDVRPNKVELATSALNYEDKSVGKDGDS